MRDFDAEILGIDWSLKNEIQWRAIFLALQQYRDRLAKDVKHDRIPHLDEYINELRDARKH